MSHLAVDIVSTEVVLEDCTYKQYDEYTFIFGECQENASVSARVYSEVFPRNQHPMHDTITDAFHRLRDRICYSTT